MGMRAYVRGLLYGLAASGVSLAIASAAEVPHPGPVQTSASGKALPPIYIGGTVGLSDLANPVLVSPLIQSGRVGLYQHAVGMRALLNRSEPASQLLLSTWAPTGIPPGGGGVGIAEEGQIPDINPQVIGDAFRPFGADRHLPVVTIMNARFGSGTLTTDGKVFRSYMSGSDLAATKVGIDHLFAKGSELVLVNYTPNFVDYDATNPFAVSPFWANVRAAYQHGGGGAFDTPPSYFMSDARYTGEPYRHVIVEQIRWLAANGEASAVIISPCGPKDASGHACGEAYDPSFMTNARLEYAYLKNHQALPNFWVVENYAATPNTTVQGPRGPVGLIAVTEWFAQHAEVRPGAISGGKGTPLSR
jgi:hypothetical protein